MWLRGLRKGCETQQKGTGADERSFQNTDKPQEAMNLRN
jgi:hypothetical protein